MPADQFDGLLNAELKAYSNPEPRPGLEGRVMARVRESRRPWLVWFAAMLPSRDREGAVTETRSLTANDSSTAVLGFLVPAGIAAGLAWFLWTPLPRVPPMALRFPAVTVESWTIAAPRPKPSGPTERQLALLRFVERFPEVARAALPESRHDDYQPIEIEALKIPPIAIDELKTEEQTQ